LTSKDIACVVSTCLTLAMATSAFAQGATRADSAAAGGGSPPPAVAPPAVAATQTAPDFPRIKVSGLMFGDLYWNASGNPTHNYVNGADLGKVNIDGNSPITKDLNGWQIRRLYLQVDDDLSIRYSVRARLEGDGKELSSGGKQTMFMKSLYLQIRQVFPRADMWIGLTQTPTFDNSETFWAYRSVEKTIADFRGVASSTDGGASLKGYVDGDHVIGYYAMMGNDTGQKPETNRDKRFYFSAPLKWHDLQVEPYFDYAYVPGNKDIATYKIFAGYEAKRVAVGYEQLQRVIHDPALAYQKPTGFSAFARGSVVPAKLNAYARYDRWIPDKNKGNRVDSDLWIAGLDYQAWRDIHLEPNLEGTQYHGRGTGPASVPPPYHDLQARFTVYYLFR